VTDCKEQLYGILLHLYSNFDNVSVLSFFFTVAAANSNANSNCRVSTNANYNQLVTKFTITHITLVRLNALPTDEQLARFRQRDRSTTTTTTTTTTVDCQTNEFYERCLRRNLERAEREAEDRRRRLVLAVSISTDDENVSRRYRCDGKLSIHSIRIPIVYTRVYANVQDG